MSHSYPQLSPRVSYDGGVEDAVRAARRLELHQAERRRLAAFLPDRLRTSYSLPAVPNIVIQPQAQGGQDAASTTAGAKSEWSAHAWLAHASHGVLDVIVEALIGTVNDEFAAVSALGATLPSSDALAARLRLGHLDAKLATRLHPAMVELARTGPADGQQLLQSKSAGAAEMTYAGLDDFRGGLESQIGAPQAKVVETMRTEHTRRPDARCEFSTGNYGVQRNNARLYKQWPSRQPPILGDRRRAGMHAERDLSRWDDMESAWNQCGGAELEPLLADMEIIDAAWLLKLAEGRLIPKRKAVVPAWQHVPPEAKLDLATLRRTTMHHKLPVAILSYGWADRLHPDPEGKQLRRLVPALRAMVKSVTDGVDRNGDEGRPAAWGIIWDFMSLPQRGRTTGYDREVDDRTPEERARFERGLKGINIWYGAPHVTTLVLDWPMPGGAQNPAPIHKRGWCIFERAMSSLTKFGDCCLTLSRMPQDDGLYWMDIVQACTADRRPPIVPDSFEHMLLEGMEREANEPGSGFRFTSGKDATAICIPQYKQGFLRLLGGAEKLSMFNCNWDDAAVEKLAEALIYVLDEGVATPAAVLNLRFNMLTDTGLRSLVAVLKAGAMPRLETVRLEGNAFTDAGLKIFFRFLHGGGAPKLKSLCLLESPATYRFGAETLAALRAVCHLRGIELPVLEVLRQ